MAEQIRVFGLSVWQTKKKVSGGKQPLTSRCTLAGGDVKEDPLSTCYYFKRIILRVAVNFPEVIL